MSYQLDLSTERVALLEDDLATCSYVFTYGTLKLGRGNDRVLTRHDAEYLGSVVTEDTYVMGNVGCPYVFKVSTMEEIGGMESTSYAPVRGDLWKVPNTACMASLDMLEGHPTHYTRELVNVVSDDELYEVSEVWMYVQLDPMAVYHCHMVELNDEGEYEW